MALQKSVAYHAAFMGEAFLFRKEMFVWVDETGCAKRRKYGYALRGERPVYHRRGTRLSAIVAMT